MSEYIVDWDENLVIDTFSKNSLREEIVRCRDCKYASLEPESDAKSRRRYQGGYWCDELSEGIGLFCAPDRFCAWGEKREA